MINLRVRVLGAAVAALALVGGLAAAADATPLAAVAAAPNCAHGGTCALGEIGPGGGKIIYVRKDIAITHMVVQGPSTILVTTAEPHHLRVTSTVTISGVNPAGLGVTDVEVSGVASPTQFTLAVDKSTYTYVSGGVIKAPRGEWDYIQAAPMNWAGEEEGDGWAGAPILTSLDASDYGAAMGSGESNTAALRAADPTGTASTNFAYIPAQLGSDWYVPSVNELLAMFDQFDADAGTRAANGFTSGMYISSTTGYVDPTNGPLWRAVDFSRDRESQTEIGAGTAFGFDPNFVRPVRKVYAHTDQTNLSVAKKVAMGASVQIASVTAQRVPVTVRVLAGSVCTVTEPARKNAKSFFIVKGGKKTGSCTLAIGAAQTRDFWALSQRVVISVTR